MYFTRKWNEIMGPKDERLEAIQNTATSKACFILLAGALITLYYSLMLNQVADTTNNPILTPLGEHVVDTQFFLIVTILLAGITMITTQSKSGSFSPYKRYAEVDSIPWDYVAFAGIACGAILGLLTCLMRIIAEIQIVGISEVTWFGDIAMGIVYFGMGFALGFAFTALTLHDAIKRRKEMEAELEE